MLKLNVIHNQGKDVTMSDDFLIKKRIPSQSCYTLKSAIDKYILLNELKMAENLPNDPKVPAKIQDLIGKPHYMVTNKEITLKPVNGAVVNKR